MRSVLIYDKFPEFSFSKIRFLIGFHLLSLWPFAVSFPKGESTLTENLDGNVFLTKIIMANVFCDHSELVEYICVAHP